jgi:hypothetical protein
VVNYPTDVSALLDALLTGFSGGRLRKRQLTLETPKSAPASFAYTIDARRRDGF